MQSSWDAAVVEVPLSWVDIAEVCRTTNCCTVQWTKRAWGAFPTVRESVRGKCGFHQLPHGEKLLKLEALVLWDLLRQSEVYSFGSKRMNWRSGSTLDMDAIAQLTVGRLTVCTSWHAPGSWELWDRVRRILSSLGLRRKPSNNGSAFHQQTIALRSPRQCCIIFCMTGQSESIPRTQVRCKVIPDQEQKRERGAKDVTTGLLGTLDSTFVTTIYGTETHDINGDYGQPEKEGVLILFVHKRLISYCFWSQLWT